MSTVCSGLSLTLHQMALPIYTGPTRQDVDVDGRVLFENFIHEELVSQGLPEDAIELENPPPDVFGDAGADYVEETATSALARFTPQGYKNSKYIVIGANLRNISDQIAKSRERQLIREQADQVDLETIDFETFTSILNELFRDGVNKSGIVALFYFCSDVLVRCVKEELNNLGSRLFFWAVDFLIKTVCKWVYDHGGWEQVFSKFSNFAKILLPIGALGALGIIIICGIIYIRNNS